MIGIGQCPVPKLGRQMIPTADKVPHSGKPPARCKLPSAQINSPKRDADESLHTPFGAQWHSCNAVAGLCGGKNQLISKKATDGCLLCLPEWCMLLWQLPTKSPVLAMVRNRLAAAWSEEWAVEKHRRADPLHRQVLLPQDRGGRQWPQRWLGFAFLPRAENP